jgi:acyl-CoA synthetase (AMP-forming)/AMP-acid ligase II
MLEELAASLRRDPERPAILAGTSRGRTVVKATRGDLAHLADGYAAALHRRGLGPGDTVAFAARPGALPLSVMLAARRLGLRVAMIDPTAGPDVVRSRLALAEPRLVLADVFAQAVAGWARPIAARAQLALPGLSSVGPVVTVGRRYPGCAPVLTPDWSGGGLPDLSGEDGEAVIVFTSGTTSRPRAVVHTWASLDAGMRAVRDLVRPGPASVVLGGTFFVLVPALAAGASVALPARSARALARQLGRLKPRETYLTPPQLRGALAASAGFTGRVWSGSAPVSADLLGRVRRAGAEQAWGIYALTEMFPVAAVEAADKAAFMIEGMDGDLVGDLVPGVSAGLDAAGQLLLTGPAAADRYLGDPPSPTIATGDVARLERDGTRLVLSGRLKDMVLRGTQNIYPGLYEPALHVPGVGLALLVGSPAPDGDERLVAIVEPLPGVDPAALRRALAVPLGRMGEMRPDAVFFADIPLVGRSRKPDRQAAAHLAARLMDPSVPKRGRR